MQINSDFVYSGMHFFLVRIVVKGDLIILDLKEKSLQALLLTLQHLFMFMSLFVFLIVCL